MTREILAIQQAEEIIQKGFDQPRGSSIGISRYNSNTYQNSRIIEKVLDIVSLGMPVYKPIAFYLFEGAAFSIENGYSLFKKVNNMVSKIRENGPDTQS